MSDRIGCVALVFRKRKFSEPGVHYCDRNMTKWVDGKPLCTQHAKMALKAKGRMVST